MGITVTVSFDITDDAQADTLVKAVGYQNEYNKLNSLPEVSLDQYLSDIAMRYVAGFAGPVGSEEEHRAKIAAVQAAARTKLELPSKPLAEVPIIPQNELPTPT